MFLYSYKKIKKLSFAYLIFGDQKNYYLNKHSSMTATGNSRSISCKFLHTSHEKGLCDNYFENALEISRNKDEHKSYLHHGYDIHLCTDLALHSDKTILITNPKVRIEIANAESLHYQENTFDIVIIRCVFHHFLNPEKAASEIRRVTKIGSVKRLALLHNPRIIYLFLRWTTTIRKPKFNSIYESVQIIHSREYRNQFLSLLKTVQIVFSHDDLKSVSYAFNLSWYNLNVLAVYQIIKGSRSSKSKVAIYEN